MKRFKVHVTRSWVEHSVMLVSAETSDDAHDLAKEAMTDGDDGNEGGKISKVTCL